MLKFCQRWVKLKRGQVGEKDSMQKGEEEGTSKPVQKQDFQVARTSIKDTKRVTGYRGTGDSNRGLF